MNSSFKEQYKFKYPDIKLNDFLNEKKAKIFKTCFTVQDVNHEDKMFENAYIDNVINGTVDFKNSITITINNNEFQYFYIPDYFKPFILIEVENSFNKITEECLDFFVKDDKIGFLEKKLHLLDMLMLEFEKSKLSSLDKDIIINGIKELIRKVETHKDKIDEDFYKKINFATTQKDLLLLFKAFYDLNIIKGISINELMSFVQNHFMYNNNKLSDSKSQLRKEMYKEGKKQLDQEDLKKLISKFCNNQNI